MSDADTEFAEALHDVQRTTGLGAIRLGLHFGVSTDMMKLLLTGRRRAPGLLNISGSARVHHTSVCYPLFASDQRTVAIEGIKEALSAAMETGVRGLNFAD